MMTWIPCSSVLTFWFLRPVPISMCIAAMTRSGTRFITRSLANWFYRHTMSEGKETWCVFVSTPIVTPLRKTTDCMHQYSLRPLIVGVLGTHFLPRSIVCLRSVFLCIHFIFINIDYSSIVFWLSYACFPTFRNICPLVFQTSSAAISRVVKVDIFQSGRNFNQSTSWAGMPIEFFWSPRFPTKATSRTRPNTFCL